MEVTIRPGKLTGILTAPPAKACAHRILICAALSEEPTEIACGPVGRDVVATIACLQALGAKIEKTPGGYRVFPIEAPPCRAILPCGESGSTLRFLLPLAGALGVEATFRMAGRLPSRPLAPLEQELTRMGCQLSRPTNDTLLCTGQLRPGAYFMDGSVSSQFLSGLRMALQRLPDSTLTVVGTPVSRPYYALTESVLQRFPIRHIDVEGDWSSAAFFLAANALGSQVRVNGLCPESCQGDRQILPLLEQLERPCTISARDVPDLIPVLSVVACCKSGAVFADIDRLRRKESDRVAAISHLLTALGGNCRVESDRLIVSPAALTGGTVDPHGDHRIAMSAAIAATVCRTPVTIRDGQCVEKSYPSFWEDFTLLGGQL